MSKKLYTVLLIISIEYSTGVLDPWFLVAENNIKNI